MNSPNPKQQVIVIWWILWASILMGLVAMYLFLKSPEAAPNSSFLRYLPLVFFAVSIGIRWALLPQMRVASKALPVFVLGLAFAEMCTMAGMFLAPDWRNIYFGLGVAGIVQFVPVFASEYYS